MPKESTSPASSQSPVDYSNFYKTTGLMACFSFLMTAAAGRVGRLSNVGARVGFLYGLHYVGQVKQEEQAALVGKVLKKATPGFFKHEKPPATINNEQVTVNLDVLKTMSQEAAHTISIGGAEIVDKIYRPK